MYPKIRDILGATGIERGRSIVATARADITFLLKSFLRGSLGDLIQPRRQMQQASAIRRLAAMAPGHIRDEIEGMAQEYGFWAPLMRKLLWSVNLFDDYWRIQHLDECLEAVACTSGVCWGFQGELLVKRCMDYPRFTEAVRKVTTRWQYLNNDDGYDFVSWGPPGYVGVITGVNEAGLFIAFHVALSHQQSLDGVPSGFLNRLVLERARTIEEAKEALEAQPKSSAGSLLVVEIPEARAGIFEIDSGGVSLRQLEQGGFLTCANHFQERRSIWFKDSGQREKDLRDGLSAWLQNGRLSFEALDSLFLSPPLLNKHTAYQVGIRGSRIEESIGGYPFRQVFLPFSVP